MDAANRRNFLKIAGIGAAAAGTAAFTSGAVGAAQSDGKTALTTGEPTIEKLHATATGSMVAYIGDVTSGEISLMVEGREFSVTDHQLVARLANALHSASATTML